MSGDLNRVFEEEKAVVEHSAFKLLQQKNMELAWLDETIQEADKIKEKIDKLQTENITLIKNNMLQLNTVALVVKQNEIEIEQLQQEYEKLTIDKKTIDQQANAILDVWSKIPLIQMPIVKEKYTRKEVVEEISFIFVGKDEDKPRKPVFHFVLRTWYKLLEQIHILDPSVDPNKMLAQNFIQISLNIKSESADVQSFFNL